MNNKYLGSSRERWKLFIQFLQEHWEILSGLAAVLGFLISTLLLWNTVETSKSIAMVTLTRNLMKDLYEDQTNKKIEDAIVNCRILYDENGGEFNYQKINRFLGVLENVGFFHEIGAIDYKTVNFAFGAMVIEAYLYREVQDYIKDLQDKEKGGQPKAFIHFQRIGKMLKDDSENEAHVDRYTRSHCPIGYKGRGN